MAETTPHYHYARGRRKEAIATVRLYPGKGEVVVGEKLAADYFNNDALMTVVEQPIKAAGPFGHAHSYMVWSAAPRFRFLGADLLTPPSSPQPVAARESGDESPHSKSTAFFPHALKPIRPRASNTGN